MKRLKLTIIAALLVALQPIIAAESIGLKFSRTGTDAQSVTISVVDENGTAIQGATATMTTSQAFMETKGAVTEAILCPNANGNTNPTITLTFTVKGISDFSFKNVGLHIHALNSAGNYQETGDNVARLWNVATAVNDASFGSLDNIDVAAGITGANKMWNIEGTETTINGETVVKLTITKGTENSGCFFGLSEVKLSNSTATPTPTPEPEPAPIPTPGETDVKVYYISWKNTNANYITEEPDNRMTVQGSDITKAQFWKFIPTEKENCYYIQNTATERYMGSCNLTPSSASKIYTSTTPVEYYVFKPSGTSGENADCWYLSSTDCDNYSDASKGPRALNKDGASSYVITWTAEVDKKGSYWKLIETEDLYEIRPFAASTEIGKIGTSYNMVTNNGKYLTITNEGVALNEYDAFDENNEWYFAGTGNATGWQIASASEPATVIGIQGGNIVAAEGLTTKWKVNASKVQNGFFYFTSEGTTLKFGTDSLFRFDRVRNAFVRSLKIYNNPCGAVSENFATKIKIAGEGAIDNILYEANSKPGKWHVMCANDKGAVAKGGKFNIDVTLKNNAENGLTAIAHFDWNSDGIFETAVPLTLNGTAGTAEVAVPDWASEEQTRMRLRVNSNGLDLAEDDVYGFIYDFYIKVVEPQEARTVTVGTNSWERGEVELSQIAESYEYGTELTAKATPLGTAQFVCWREEGVVVSTDAEYTFTVDHNVKLVAYFTPNTDEKSYPTNAIEAIKDSPVKVEQQGNSIVAECESNVQAMTLYTADAATIATCKGNVLNIATMKEGIYIVSVMTADGYKNVKIFIKK